MTSTKTRRIKVEALTRVEGEGAIEVHIRDGVVTDVALHIYEPPRFFEALLRGRRYDEAPDITARICGICPVAYILGASRAMEDVCGVTIGGALSDLRRLIYCGEWIESHVLHAAMLHAPDFLGLPDAFALAKQMPEVVGRALALKKLGNRLIEVIGGRAIHPVNLKVGGFYRVPSQAAIRALIAPLRQGIEDAVFLAHTFSGFDFPELAIDYTFVSLRHPNHYAIEDGEVVSNRGLGIPVRDYTRHFAEEQVARSTALHGRTTGGKPYLLGPLARYNNNVAQLTPRARAMADAIGLGETCTNPFRSILVRMVETVLACEEALRLSEAYVEPAESCVPIPVGAGVGHGATEAPRGICYHSYRVDAEGRILNARIMPPTSQNQRQIEDDLRRVVEANLHQSNEGLQARCEQAIRNHDPCISCATHTLDVRIERE